MTVGQSSTPFVKQEGPSFLTQPADHEDVKTVLRTATVSAMTKHYDVFVSASQINYSPEESLRNGLGMVKTLKERVDKLELGSKLRKEVWLREIAGFVVFLYTTSMSKTMI